jgi:hypothetical protein
MRIAFALALFATACGDARQRKDAWRGCGPALATGTADCDFLRMCANEAPLTGAERERLAHLVSEGGCAPP